MSNNIEEKLKKLFDNAIDISDTIWYSPTETLYDAILSLIEEEDQETKNRITARLNWLHGRYRLVSSDTIDPELEAQIRELKWVLEGITYIRHDSTT